MRRLLTTLLISLAFVSGVVAFAPKVLAQADCGQPPLPACPTAIDEIITPSPGAGTVTASPAPSIGDGAGMDLKTAEKTPTPSPAPSAPMGEGMAGAMQSIMTLFAWLLGVAVITLDNVVFYTVVTMGNVVNKLSAIGVAWRILRDIANIALIFGFLAVGISTILDSDLYGWSGKLIPKLLMAAIFLNFSLFFTEAVIDVGNMFATQFYMQINGGNAAGAKDITDWSAITNDGIASKLMNQLGLQRIYGETVKNTDLFKPDGSLIVAFMGVILFLITAFVMFALAFILVARFVILILLIVVAPIGFAGYAVPKLQGIAKQWSDMLIQQTITAPILLLSLYVALAVITDAQFLTGFGVNGSSDWTGFVKQSNLQGFAGILLSFLVAIGLLLGVIIISKKLSKTGSDWATKTAGKLTFGATAWGMRSTVGAGSLRVSRAIRTSALGSTKTGRLLAAGLDRGAKASFDLRNTDTVKNIPFGGIGAGKGKEGGYRKTLDDSIKGHEEYVKSIGKAYDEAGKEGKKVAQQAYGENIQNSPIKSWAIFGSGSSIAAAKIVKDKKKEIKEDNEEKTIEKKYFEYLKKNAKKSAEDEIKRKNEEGGEGKKEEKEPEEKKKDESEK